MRGSRQTATMAVLGLIVFYALLGVAQSAGWLREPDPLHSDRTGQSKEAVKNPAGLWAVEYRWGDPAPGYKQVNATRLESWQHVRIENRGEVAVYDLAAEVMDTPSSVTVVDGTITVGDIPAGGSAWSADTFSVQVDSNQQQDPCAGLRWRIEYDDGAVDRQVIENVPEFPPGRGGTTSVGCIGRMTATCTFTTLSRVSQRLRWERARMTAGRCSEKGEVIVSSSTHRPGSAVPCPITKGGEASVHFSRWNNGCLTWMPLQASAISR